MLLGASSRNEYGICLHKPFQLISRAQPIISTVLQIKEMPVVNADRNDRRQSQIKGAVESFKITFNFLRATCDRMECLRFQDFLAHRFLAAVNVSVAPDVIQAHPRVLYVFFDTWREIEAKNTAPYRYRLVFEEPVLTDAFFSGHLAYFANQITDVQSPPKLCFVPWLKFWLERLFLSARWPEHFHTDIPLCYIYITATPSTLARSPPPWMAAFDETVPVFNIVIDPTVSKRSPIGPVTTVPDASPSSFFDFIVRITHTDAVQRLTALRESAELYVTRNWRGLGNSLMRMVGFGVRGNRSETIVQVKRLGDLCMASGRYGEAMAHYRGLCHELGEGDPPVRASLFLMLAVASILTTNEFDVLLLLKPFIHEPCTPTAPHVCVMLFIVAIFYATYYRKRSAYALYMGLLHFLKTSDFFNIGRISAPIIREAAATTVSARHAAISLYQAAVEYQALGLTRNALIAFWRTYNCISPNCWPQIAHWLLLEIARFGKAPENFLRVLMHRTLSFIPETVAQLKNMEFKSLVFVEFVIVHGLQLDVTGFPCSPPPRLMNSASWAKLRKHLFPLSWHPSIEQLAAETAMTDSEISTFTTVVGESLRISLRVSTTLSPGCHVAGLRLFIEPEESATVSSLEDFVLSETTEFAFTFSVARPGPFQIKGLRFDFFGVAPVAVLFAQPVLYRALSKAALLGLSLLSNPDIAYVAIPCRFSVLLQKIRGSISGVIDAIVQTSPNKVAVRLLQPEVPNSFNRFPLPAFTGELALDFELVPDREGPLKVYVFIAYALADRHERFAFARFAVDVCGLRKVCAQVGNDRVFLTQADGLQKISCGCAGVRLEGTTVIVDSVIPTDQKCTLELERVVIGTVLRDSIALSRVFVRFGAAEMEVRRCPTVVEFAWEVICLGRLEGELLLIGPGSLQWCWVGKTRFALKGPAVVEVAPRMLVTTPVDLELEEFVSLVYGNETRPFRHAVSVRVA
jgi:hypothetical protein